MWFQVIVGGGPPDQVNPFGPPPNRVGKTRRKFQTLPGLVLLIRSPGVFGGSGASNKNPQKDFFSGVFFPGVCDLRELLGPGKPTLKPPTHQTGTLPGISETGDQPGSATPAKLPSCSPADRAGIQAVVSRGPNPTIATHVRYCVYANVQKEHNPDLFVYKCLTNRGPLPPINLDYTGLSLSTMKVLVFDHLRNKSPSKYPIDMAAIQAKRGLVLKWYYSVVEPKDVANEATASPNSIWTYHNFVPAAVTLSPNAKVTMYLNVPEDTIQFRPCAIVTLVVKDSLPETLYGVVVTDEPAGCGQDEGRLIVPKRHLAQDNLPTPKRPNVHFSQSGLPSGNPTFLTMNKFLALCEIPLTYQPVQDIIAKHDIFNWSSFQGVSSDDLQNLGLKWGTAQAILVGVKKASLLSEPQL
ncbi:uncharacterized protein PGTG_19368 [Puccinia graminis f. sp. tritici CRL 75-36-700-3]|uniref:SAM domain-containing protein n=2 Tax=Puccinia graminis f. sp. tritici TaxID=56615 RepID=E3L963_PUCGT|nr:uncharacterized protein PGTG_19368 [Puccinia graminis f. sp. tritici CRL 75-36-700-3]EFP93088.2 hypothetical protein PGTG_19368 [Puccinia graminis f. sp. tritici CRL 75-36-700-3]